MFFAAGAAGVDFLQKMLKCNVLSENSETIVNTVLAGINILWFALNLNWMIVWIQAISMTFGPVLAGVVYTAMSGILMGTMIGVLFAFAVFENDEKLKPILSFFKRDNNYGSCPV